MGNRISYEQARSRGSRSKLLFHASSKSERPSHRRVLHADFLLEDSL